MAASIASNFVRRNGAGPDQAHVTFQDIHQLQQLIQAELPENAPDASHARVVGQLEFSVALFGASFDEIPNVSLVHSGVRVLIHGPELQHAKVPNNPEGRPPQPLALGSDAFLAENDRAW